MEFWRLYQKVTGKPGEGFYRDVARDSEARINAVPAKRWSNQMWYVVTRIAGYRILEGASPHGGLWAAQRHGEFVTFMSRRDAEQHAEMSDA